MNKTILLIGSLGGIALIAAVWTAEIWTSLAAAEMSIHGWIALGLGAVLSLALGGGLMALTFFSSKRGYDDQVAEFGVEDFEVDEDDRRH